MGIPAWSASTWIVHAGEARRGILRARAGARAGVGARGPEDYLSIYLYRSPSLPPAILAVGLGAPAAPCRWRGRARRASLRRRRNRGRGGGGRRGARAGGEGHSERVGGDCRDGAAGAERARLRSRGGGAWPRRGGRADPARAHGVCAGGGQCPGRAPRIRAGTCVLPPCGAARCVRLSAGRPSPAVAWGWRGGVWGGAGRGAGVAGGGRGGGQIADFGATLMLSGCKTMTEDGKQIQGTPFWMAPEARPRPPAPAPRAPGLYPSRLHCRPAAGGCPTSESFFSAEVAPRHFFACGRASPTRCPLSVPPQGAHPPAAASLGHGPASPSPRAGRGRQPCTGGAAGKPGPGDGVCLRGGRVRA